MTGDPKFTYGTKKIKINNEISLLAKYKVSIE